MNKGRNSNHPVKGSTIKVGPITDLKDIKTIKALLAGNPRDLCLFVMGINTNLRASDLARVTAGDVKGLIPGDELTLKEKKTGKERRTTLNNAVIDVIKRLLTSKLHIVLRSAIYVTERRYGAYGAL